MEHTAASLNLMATQLLEKDDAVPPARRDTVWTAELADDSVTELLRSYQRVGGLNNRDAHLKRQILGREEEVAITKGKLDLGPWEQVFTVDSTVAGASVYW